VTGKGVSRLLEFLAGSFHGGTDVDEPFIRALSRLEEEAWSNADVLLVTDGEIRPPDEDVLRNLDAAKEEMGLKVHGLLVGERRRRGAVHAHPHVQELERRQGGEVKG
jgi:uncharacterized protein with von Willebrand factor type A (vWA) domain